MLELKLPDHINYECTGCGKCCSGWTLPMTEEDYDRISEVDWGALNPEYKNRELFRELKKYERENTPYTHKIVSNLGPCPFLKDNLCFIHGQKGAEFKPAMCQQFPYGFTETPSGVYATVSFVSWAVVDNTGLPLREQQPTLERKWKDFQRLYPDYHPDWSQIKLAVGQPISWDQYMVHENEVLAILADKSATIEARLERAAAYLVSKMEGTTATAEALLSVAVAPVKPLDKDVLLTFHRMYFPARPLKQGEADFSIAGFLKQKLMGSKRIATAAQSFSFEELAAVEFPQSDEQITDLIYRYVYSYIFGKKYFGAGFGQVSVIAGFHHLILMVSLLKLQSRANAKLRGGSLVTFADVANAIRQLERQVGETKLGGYAAALWELLLSPPQRARRFLKL